VANPYGFDGGNLPDGWVFDEDGAVIRETSRVHALSELVERIAAQNAAVLAELEELALVGA
jgi:hypothetical protein